MSEERVREYDEKLRRGEVERLPGALPPHWPTCFGCGPESENGLQVVFRRVGEEVHASYAFRKEHEGAPGIVHGGLVAALVDDVCGGILFLVKAPAVTRKLEVEYLKPVLVGETYDLVARVERREGRKLFLACEGTNSAGEVAFRGGGLFLVVDLSHFGKAGGTGSQGESPVAL